jgi:hypothetical protein
MIKRLREPDGRAAHAGGEEAAHEPEIEIVPEAETGVREKDDKRRGSDEDVHQAPRAEVADRRTITAGNQCLRNGSRAASTGNASSV